MTDKYVTMKVDGWDWIVCPMRWVKDPEKAEIHGEFSSLLGYQQDRDPEYDSDFLLTPGCVNLACMDSIHAVANCIYLLWDDGIFNNLAAEAFNPALAGKGLTLHVTVDACEDTLDHFSVHASMDDGHNTADLEDDDRLDEPFPATKQGWLDAVDFANEYFEKKKRAQPAIEGGVRYTQDASRAASIATRPGGADSE